MHSSLGLQSQWQEHRPPESRAGLCSCALQCSLLPWGPALSPLPGGLWLPPVTSPKPGTDMEQQQQQFRASGAMGGSCRGSRGATALPRGCGRHIPHLTHPHQLQQIQAIASSMRIQAQETWHHGGPGVRQPRPTCRLCSTSSRVHVCLCPWPRAGKVAPAYCHGPLSRRRNMQ